MGTSQGHYHIVRNLDERSRENLDRYITKKIEEITTKNKSAVVKVEEYKNPRSLSSNALYWVWMGKLADELNRKNIKLDNNGNSLTWNKDYAHDLMGKFLRENTELTMGKTRVTSVQSTRSMNKSEFNHYMTKVYHWCFDTLGLILPDPKNSEYREYKDKQEA